MPNTGMSATSLSQCQPDRPSGGPARDDAPAPRELPLFPGGCWAWLRPSVRSRNPKDDLKRRIDEAARFIPLEQLCLSGQCGFSSTVDGNNLTLDQEIAKLELAAEVWG